MSDVFDRPLHGVAIYNPRLLSKDELIKTFVARQSQLDRLVDALRREAVAQPQHHLMVGARGMGKTTLLNRLRFAIEDDDVLSTRCLGLAFPEEQYNIGTLADFWLNCVYALADEFESSERTELLEGLDEEIARIQALTTPDERRQDALGLLCRLSDRLDRRLVLLVDNLDLVLDRLQDEQWSLREVLSNEARIQIVGATSAPLEAYYRHDKAFYDFFRVHHLTGLGEEETFDVLRRLAHLTGHAQIEELLEKDPGRIKSIRLMAGGNPRTVVLLFSLLAQGSQGDVRSDIERLLDHCTPFYKHRIEALSTQAQRVLYALAMHWAPATAAEIATAMHLKVNAVSSQLDRLVKDGTVEKVTLPDTKKYGFQIAERFFNIWCLMRASRRVRCRLVWLAEFLRLMFGPAELSIALQDTSLHRHTLANLLVARDEWNEARPHAKRLLGAPDTYLAHYWPDILRFFNEVVEHGFITEARNLLAELDRSARWEPLDRALALLEHDDLESLGRLAPEMRDAVELVLAKIAPKALEEHTQHQ